jgi:hypothetical protein
LQFQAVRPAVQSQFNGGRLHGDIFHPSGSLVNFTSAFGMRNDTFWDQITSAQTESGSRGETCMSGTGNYTRISQLKFDGQTEHTDA